MKSLHILLFIAIVAIVVPASAIIKSCDGTGFCVMNQTMNQTPGTNGTNGTDGTMNMTANMTAGPAGDPGAPGSPGAAASIAVNYTFTGTPPNVVNVGTASAALLDFTIPNGTGTSDHHLLTNLTTGDDHTQYLNLSGRPGGQVAYGGIASGDNLTLNAKSGSSAAASVVKLQSGGGNVEIGPAPPFGGYQVDVNGTMRLYQNFNTNIWRGLRITNPASTGLYTGAGVAIETYDSSRGIPYLVGDFFGTGSSWNYGIYGNRSYNLVGSGWNGLNFLATNTSAGYIRFATGGEAVTNERMNINPAGNVNISNNLNANSITTNSLIMKTMKLIGGGIDGTIQDQLYFGNASYPTTYLHKISSSQSSSSALSLMKFSLASGASTFYDALTMYANGNVTVPGRFFAPQIYGNYAANTNLSLYGSYTNSGYVLSKATTVIMGSEQDVADSQPFTVVNDASSKQAMMIKGQWPTLQFNLTRTGGGVAQSIMRVNFTNTTDSTTIRALDIGTYGSVQPVSVNYAYLTARENGTYLVNDIRLYPTGDLYFNPNGGTSLFGAGSFTANASLKLSDATKAFMPSKTTPGAIVGAVEGMVIYDTTNKTLAVRNDSQWMALGTGGGGSTITKSQVCEYMYPVDMTKGIATNVTNGSFETSVGCGIWQLIGNVTAS